MFTLDSYELGWTAKMRKNKAYLIVLLMFSAGQIQAQNSLEIGFGEAVGDSDVVSVLDENGVSPQALYIWVAGISGTRRPSPLIRGGSGAKEFVKDAREKTISSFENALQGNEFRLSTLVENYSVEEISDDNELNSMTRQLLVIREQIQEGLEWVRSGKPIIYGAKITGDAENIGKARSDSRVKASKGEELFFASSPDSISVRPSSYRDKYSNSRSRVMDMSKNELVQYLQKITSKRAK